MSDPTFCEAQNSRQSQFDGIYSRILLIKDLSSGKMLMAIPCKSEDAETTIACLATLFKWYGPPLVIKSDNGTGFKSDKIKDYLEKQNVLQLFSPRGTPSYNGSVEE
ncbi:MAG: transposase family protein [Planctomycetes bacterium]|nr:transposase family protein [Planctomycetota bacterium]